MSDHASQDLCAVHIKELLGNGLLYFEEGSVATAAAHFAEAARVCRQLSAQKGMPLSQGVMGHG